jgi:hypothetical protein
MARPVRKNMYAIARVTASATSRTFFFEACTNRRQQSHLPPVLGNQRGVYSDGESRCRCGKGAAKRVVCAGRVKRDRDGGSSDVVAQPANSSSYRARKANACSRLANEFSPRIRSSVG